MNLALITIAIVLAAAPSSNTQTTAQNPAPTPSPTTDTALADAQRLLDTDQPEAAAKILARWPEEGPPAPAELRFDVAHALATADSPALDAAALLFEQAAQQANHPRTPSALARDAAANLGRVHFEAVKPPAAGPNAVAELEKVADQLWRAERAYRAALDIDPNDTDAMRSLEIVRRRLADLLNQAEQAQQQQQQ
ncbi:MAG: hypothetical protein AAGK04_09570, partial [Planctomycetota bacterium]